MTRLPLTLASSSPRRKQLLTQAGYAFRVVPPASGAEDDPRTGESPRDYVMRSARQKAADVASRCGPGLILGCDTVAVCEGDILGKPRNRDHAESMLKAMSGRPHHVLSGVCLIRRPDDATSVKCERTELQMSELAEPALQAYLDSNDWVGKAGAFGYQDGLDWVHIVEGSESNVVGLPLATLAQMLPEMDVPAT